MKKLIFFILLLIFSASLLPAQIKIIPQGGLNLATFSGADAEAWGGLESNPKLVLRFHAGAFFDVLEKAGFRLQPGIRYSYKGTKYKGSAFFFDPELGSEFEGEGSYTKHLHYLDIPVKVRYFISENFDVFIGPQVSILMAAKVKGEFGGIEASADAKDDYATAAFALLVGGGYYLDNNILVQVELDLGLSNVVEGYEGTKPKVKNTVIMFTVGYPIN